jgi:hypothetical protein
MDKTILDGLMKAMVNPEDMKFRFKGLFYGDPGSWKTVTGCRIGKKVLFISADPEGWQSLLNHPELGLGTRIQLMEYQGISQLEAIAQAFDEDQPLVREFDTVNLDTLSHIASMDLAVVQKQKILKVGGEDKFDFEKEMWPVYNQNSMRVKNALMRLLRAPINVVATAHAKEFEVKKFGVATGQRRLAPKFSPEIFSDINANFSMIAYMANEVAVDRQSNVRYTPSMQFHPTQTIVAKSRIGGLPVKQNNPDIVKIVEEWIDKGGQLIAHEEAEELRPDDQGIAAPVASDLSDLI